MTQTQAAPKCTIIIFGAAGDLTKRLLMPSIYNLMTAGLLDAETQIIGADHNDRDSAGWRKELTDALHEFSAAKNAEAAGKIDEQAWSKLADRLDYVKFDFTNDDDYASLAKRLHDAGNVLFYLAVSPHFFETIAAGLSKAGAFEERENAFRRLIIEKPFGRDLESARKLNGALTAKLAETQIYRIDHFLGKEAVYGILGLRFGSRMIEPLLNREHIASVQITAAETVGVEDRGSFYETTGALRDMVPNHLFSVLTLLTMDQPEKMDSETVRDAKVKLLDALRPLSVDKMARGQYAAGRVEDKQVKAYTEEDNVAKDSRTETYAALEVHIDNDRWREVPFYIRTGKRMAAHVTTVVLELRPPESPLNAGPTEPHILVLGIDPQRGLMQRYAAKKPGVDLALGRTHSGFKYDEIFSEPPNIGYETLLFDALRGQAVLYQRDDMIEREWAVLQPVLDAWERDPSAPESYTAGSAGPPGADALLAKNNHAWFDVAPLTTLGDGTSAKK